MSGGSLPTFPELYHEHRDRVFRFCFRLCEDRSDAEDLAQDVWLLAYEGLGQFQGRGYVTGWLYRIALRRWSRIQQSRRLPARPLEMELTRMAHPDSTEGTVLERMTLDAAVATLPEPLRIAFLLVRVEGLKYREAAAVLGVAQGTVQSRVHDACAHLRRLLRDADAPETQSSGREPKA